ncbi:cysteine desulfurase family protein [Candidatus Methylacidiphilum infernorum]|uniref:Cysteine sulfinate desulfinase/cysteine desulfurase or related enzyme n=1 Tax=Methylacidiphilum infernorum (isolate V4) TaxID=481448 RepID=B3DVB0_METI4|nr:cysteine desulfurase family protein [Candidatus Methylacidiphilum infernorum]ACD83263.1 Cysteine sulfinate desulfinase/cysteine desulfurase or related enzyme [Methylacidiphilum infernorum V4]
MHKMAEVGSTIYLDHQSAAPVFPEALEILKQHSIEPFSPSSLHQRGIYSKKVLQSALECISAFLGCEETEIVFTGGSWEAIVLGIEGFWRRNASKGKHILTTPIEQKPILLLFEKLKNEGATVSYIPVDKEGFVDPKAIEELSTSQTILCCVQWVNPEIGSIQNVQEVAHLCFNKGIAFFCDGSYAAGWVPIDLKQLPISLLVVNPNQFNGPKGVGILCVKKGFEIEPIIPGLNRDFGFWGGSENLPAVLATAKAAEITSQLFKEKIEKVSYLQKLLWNDLLTHIPLIALNGPQPGFSRSIQNLNVSPEFIGGESQVLSCDLKGIMISSGPSCIQKNLRVSHVFKAVGLGYHRAVSSVRISLGITTTKEEIEKFAKIYREVVAKLREMSIGWKKYLSDQGKNEE